MKPMKEQTVQTLTIHITLCNHYEFGHLVQTRRHLQGCHWKCILGAQLRDERWIEFHRRQHDLTYKL
jgi:hypothetical protein